MFLCCNFCHAAHCLDIKDKFIQWGTNKDPSTLTLKRGVSGTSYFSSVTGGGKGFPDRKTVFFQGNLLLERHFLTTEIGQAL